MSRGPTLMEYPFQVSRDNSITRNRKSQPHDDIFYIQIQVRSALKTRDPSSDDDEPFLYYPLGPVYQKSFTVGRNYFLSDDNAEILMCEKLSSMGVPTLAQLEMIHQVRCLSRRMNEEAGDSSGPTVLPILLIICLMTVEGDDDDGDEDESDDDDDNDDEVLSRAVMDSIDDMFLLRPAAASESSIEGLEKIRVVESTWGIKEEYCMICLEDIGVGLEVTRMPCLHVYHSDCIVQWLETSHVCPLCRFQMPRREVEKNKKLQRIDSEKKTQNQHYIISPFYTLLYIFM